MAYQYPYGDTQQLNLAWFLDEFKALQEAWEQEKQGITGALDAEIARAEAALSGVIEARDQAAASAADALAYRNAAQSASQAAELSKTNAETARRDASNYAVSAAGSAQNASNSAIAAGNSATLAESAKTTAIQQANAAVQASGAASGYAQTAGQEAANAAASATAAGGSATAAAGSATTAGEEADRAEAAADAGLEQKTITDVQIASFSDGADNIPVKKMTVDIEPVQDLHGYDHPWPAGGGKNLLHVDSRVYPGTISNIAYSSDDEYVYMNGTKQGGGYAHINSLTLTLPVGTYYARAFVISGSTTNSIALYPYDGSSDLCGDIFGAERTFTLESEKTFYFRFAIWTDGTVITNYKIGIVVSKTSGIDKFYPYSNICPITGHTSAKVTRTGKNIANIFEDGYVPSTSNGQLVQATGCRSNFIKVKPNTNYTISQSNTDNSIYIFYYTAQKEFISFISTGASSITITIPEQAVYIMLRTNLALSAIGNIQCEHGSTATTYEPYQGETYDITFPSEAGTVYGGTLDVTSGVLTVDRVDSRPVVDVLQSINSYGIANFSFPITIPASDNYTKKGKAISNVLKTQKSSIADVTEPGIMIANRLSGFVRLNSADADSIAKANEWIENNNLIIVYFLETPITYTLTAAEIRTLLGTNNIWADTGDIAELIYRAMNNTRAMIKLTKALIAPVLDSMVADTALVVNDFRIVGDTLYKVTAPIASGGTLTVGTNVTATTIGAQITALLA